MRDADWYTTREVADVLGATGRTVANWARAGWLTHHTMPGGHRRFRREDVERFLHDRGSRPARDDPWPSRAEGPTTERTPRRRR